MKDAAAIVKTKFTNHLKSVVGKMDATAIHDLLGEQTLKKLRNFDVQRIQNKNPNSAIENKTINNNKVLSSKPMNTQEYREYMASLKESM